MEKSELVERILDLGRRYQSNQVNVVSFFRFMEELESIVPKPYHMDIRKKFVSNAASDHTGPTTYYHIAQQAAEIINPLG